MNTNIDVVNFMFLPILCSLEMQRQWLSLWQPAPRIECVILEFKKKAA